MSATPRAKWRTRAELAAVWMTVAALVLVSLILMDVPRALVASLAPWFLLLLLCGLGIAEGMLAGSDRPY